MISELVTASAPRLLEQFRIGVETAAEIPIVAVANPERARSLAAFAKLAGISPAPAGSKMTSGKYRINHGRHRQLNAAIYRTVIVRMRFHESTIAYVNLKAEMYPGEYFASVDHFIAWFDLYMCWTPE
ncbi:transposase [Brevibacterium aurantiacum]|uniref:IS110 family transposase n=1 Tax=Brevibacterium aurantiacum TaxID=273384 RepID=A0A556CAQ2_BREAU|nr:IS110 family transposase [Brevibacterium aurantiacum]